MDLETGRIFWKGSKMTEPEPFEKAAEAEFEDLTDEELRKIEGWLEEEEKEMLEQREESE